VPLGTGKGFGDRACLSKGCYGAKSIPNAALTRGRAAETTARIQLDSQLSPFPLPPPPCLPVSCQTVRTICTRPMVAAQSSHASIGAALQCFSQSPQPLMTDLAIPGHLMRWLPILQISHRVVDHTRAVRSPAQDALELQLGHARVCCADSVPACACVVLGAPVCARGGCHHYLPVSTMCRPGMCAAAALSSKPALTQAFPRQSLIMLTVGSRRAPRPDRPHILAPARGENKPSAAVRAIPSL
jgi:hypothetical protein